MNKLVIVQYNIHLTAIKYRFIKLKIFLKFIIKYVSNKTLDLRNYLLSYMSKWFTI